MKTIQVKILGPCKTDKILFDREKRYGGFYDMYLKYRNKYVSLDKLKKWIKRGDQIILGEINNTRYIKCGLNHNDRWDGIMPVVIASNHRRFIPGKRFDYGFMCVALRDNFCISYNFK